MIQNKIKVFNNDNEINDEVVRIECCKYCTVVDIRILSSDCYLTKAQIIYDYDIETYAKDKEEAAKNKT